MIVVKLPSGGVDLAPLKKALAEQVAGASLDDHRAWIDRMRTMAQTTIAGGIGLLILMLAATVLSVIFATRGAMATNRPIVEVLHFIGAKSGFIAGQFQRHFLMLGLEGGLIGGGLAMLLFGLAGIAARHERRHGERRSGGGAVRQLRARLGRLSRDCRADRAGRRGHGGCVAADGQSHPGNGRVAPCHPARRILRYHPAGESELMDAIGSGTAAGDSRATRPVAAAPPSARRSPVRCSVSCASLSFGGGFLWFVHRWRRLRTAPARNADGIVALTGGAFRINDALELLAAGRGKRLLITGVNPVTRPGEISRLMPEHQRWFACCVDIDHSATNTIGNAIETRRWVKARGFRSLIVVTANFHMPRAMAELAHELPDVALVPYPVVSDKVRVESWWENPETARLLVFGVFEVYRRQGPHVASVVVRIGRRNQFILHSSWFETWSSSGPFSSTSCSI